MARGHRLMPNRKARIERTIVELVAAFPLAFSTEPEQVRPLGIGIKQRIYERCTLSHRDIGAALRCYTGRVAYLLAIVEGTPRIDLDGAPNGTVSANEATHAAEQIRKIFAKAVGKPRDRIRPSVPATTHPRSSSGRDQRGPIQRQPVYSNSDDRFELQVLQGGALAMWRRSSKHRNRRSGESR
jgi:sRNA-binding protein